MANTNNISQLLKSIILALRSSYILFVSDSSRRRLLCVAQANLTL